MTLSDDEARAISLFQGWWNFHEAGAELDYGKPLNDESPALHYSGNGASCTVFVRDLRALSALLDRITDDADEATP